MAISTTKRRSTLPLPASSLQTAWLLGELEVGVAELPASSLQTAERLAVKRNVSIWSRASGRHWRQNALMTT